MIFSDSYVNYYWYNNPQEYEVLPKKVRKEFDEVLSLSSQYRYHGQLKEGSKGFLGLFKSTPYNWQKKNKKGEWEYVYESSVDKRIVYLFKNAFQNGLLDCNYTVKPTEESRQSLTPLTSTYCYKYHYPTIKTTGLRTLPY